MRRGQVSGEYGGSCVRRSQIAGLKCCGQGAVGRSSRAFISWGLILNILVPDPPRQAV
jgi:hypothetical protein